MGQAAGASRSGQASRRSPPGCPSRLAPAPAPASTSGTSRSSSSRCAASWPRASAPASSATGTVRPRGDAAHPPAARYPPDLLHASPPRAFFSLLLSLHLPLAALALYALARHLGAGRLGAACGGVLFALGGFALSTLNLYVYAQALPWVPLLVLTARRAAMGGRRRSALAALVTATALSTTAVEFAAQAVVMAAVLLPRPGTRGAGPRRPRDRPRSGARGVRPRPALRSRGGSARDAASRPTWCSPTRSSDDLLQTVVAGLYADPAHVADRFWGRTTSPGFPYFLSLYLG